jgi:signal transduction histidine kinase
VFTRRLSVRLLAPTLLVSLALLGACTLVVLYLNDLHVNVARDLSENVQSTLVASLLETTTTKLVGLLRSNHTRPRLFAQQVELLNQEARDQLAKASDLANLDREKVLVGMIQDGFQEYFEQWKARGSQADRDAELARHLEEKVLTPCRELRSYNTDQFVKSDSDNLAIVQNLQWSLLAVGLGGPVGGLLLGYAVARSLRHSIYQLSVRIRDAAGRLNRELGSVTLEEEGDLPDLHRQMQGVTEEIERVVEQLQQREREVLRAEQLAAVGQVAAGVAHELRNPLTSVKMLVQTALEGVKGNGLPAEDLTVIEHEIRRMEQCIRLFLDFARPPDSERRRTDLTEVIRRALALVEGRAHRQKVHMAATLPERPILMKIDPEQIHQVLVNLFLNALDALPRGGTVQVHVADGEAHDSKPGQVEVRIVDNGAGIAPRIRQRLFEPFVSSKETGLGLGLSICKRLIEAHGGTIRGENAREGGAVFTFTLPVEEGRRQEAGGRRQEAEGRRQEAEGRRQYGLPSTEPYSGEGYPV